MILFKFNQFPHDILKAMPIGSIIMWVGKTQPDGWLLCEGSLICGSKENKPFGSHKYDKLCDILGLSIISILWADNKYRCAYLPNLVDRYPKGVGANNANLKTTGNKYNSISLNPSQHGRVYPQQSSHHGWWENNNYSLKDKESFDVARTYVKFIIKYK